MMRSGGGVENLRGGLAHSGRMRAGRARLCSSWAPDGRAVDMVAGM